MRDDLLPRFVKAEMPALPPASAIEAATPPTLPKPAVRPKRPAKRPR
jgi:hypothetical protein